MTPMPAVRVAAKNDLDSLLVLMEKYYEYDGREFDRKKARRAMRGLLADSALGMVFLASDKNVAVGYLVLAFGYSLEYHGRDAFLDEFFIDKGTGARGLARKCLHARKALPKSLGSRPST